MAKDLQISWINRMRRLLTTILKSENSHARAETKNLVSTTPARKKNLEILPTEILRNVVENVDSVDDLMNFRRANRRINEVVETSLVGNVEKTPWHNIFGRLNRLSDLSERLFEEALPDGKLPEAHVPETNATWIDTGSRTILRILAVAPTLKFQTTARKSQFANELLGIADPKVKLQGLNIVAEYIGAFDRGDRSLIVGIAFDALQNPAFGPSERSPALMTIVRAQGYLQGNHLSKWHKMQKNTDLAADINRAYNRILRERRIHRENVSTLNSFGQIDAALDRLHEGLKAEPAQIHGNYAQRSDQDINHRLGDLASIGGNTDIARQSLMNTVRNRGRSGSER